MKYGIYIQFGSKNNYVADNVIIAPATAPIYDAGVDTVYKYALKISKGSDGQLTVKSTSGPDYKVSLYTAGSDMEWELIDTQMSNAQGVATFTYTPGNDTSVHFFRASQTR